MVKTNRVLVVDDDGASRAMLGLSLRQNGFSVDSAPGGPEALDLLREREYDWMVTDARMLPMDGFELSRRAAQLRPRLRIAMVSALCAQEDIAGYPIEGLFLKPVAVEDLVELLRESGR